MSSTSSNSSSSDNEDDEIDMMARQVGDEMARAPGQHPSFHKFMAIIKRWEEDRSNSGFDPTAILEEMADLLELETSAFLGRDLDPLDNRHPARMDPDCQLGHLLKAFFKKDSLVQDLFNNYLHDKYFHRQGRVINMKCRINFCQMTMSECGFRTRTLST